MEEKVATLAPPVIFNPKEGDEIETLVLEGSGKPGASIIIESNFLDAQQGGGSWARKTEVKSNGHWQYHVTDFRAKRPGMFWFRAKQEQYWPPEISEPSEKVTFTKLLPPPVFTKPRAGESLPQLGQTIEGTGVHSNMGSNAEIELTTLAPPVLTYKTSASLDPAGWWRATPEWTLVPGSYALKCRQTYESLTSRWGDDLIVEVK